MLDRIKSFSHLSTMGRGALSKGTGSKAASSNGPQNQRVRSCGLWQASARCVVFKINPSKKRAA